MEKEKLKKLQVFGFDGLQNLVTLLRILEREQISLDEVISYVEFTVEINRKRTEDYTKRSKQMQLTWQKNTRKCLECKSPLNAKPITIPKGKGNINGYSCHWFCSSEECTYEKYTHENYSEIYKKIMGGN